MQSNIPASSEGRITGGTNATGAMIFHQGFVRTRLIPGAIGRLLLLIVIIQFANGGTHAKYVSPPWTVLAAILLVAAWWMYKQAEITAKNLVIDAQGVWCEAGVFPWQKARYGQLWGNIGGAGHPVGFISWRSGVFDVQLFHRFTNETIFELKDVKNGNVAVETINKLLASQGPLK